MGGLIIQLFILQEIVLKRRKHLDRLTEVVLYGTPSGGLLKAAFAGLFNTQAADMSRSGALIRNLRDVWDREVDAKRATDGQRFQLTLAAGMEDNFVPQSSSLDPFPFDEKEIVPGDHGEMVKPQSSGDLAYLVLKKRLLRGTLAALIAGRDEETAALMAGIGSARRLEDTEALTKIAEDILFKPPATPKAERELGLALLDGEDYSRAAKLLTRYLNFRMPETGEQPFQHDAQAHQQLAIALSGAGDIPGSVAHLEKLDPTLRSDPETLGILGGRFKRQWLKSERKPQVARRALALYEEARGIAEKAKRIEQVFYNGINAAYLAFAIGDRFEEKAEAVLEVLRTYTPDYWSEATRAEALLLLTRYPEALAAYQSASRCDHAPRHWSSTGQQALDILRRQGRPQQGAEIERLFGDVLRDF
jgi:tetratricopeptide (TPR) repeat protein